MSAERLYVPSALSKHVEQCSSCPTLKLIAEPRRCTCKAEGADGAIRRRRREQVRDLLSLSAWWVRKAASYRPSPDSWLYDNFLGTASGYWGAAAYVAGVPVEQWPSFSDWSSRYLAACAAHDEAAAAEIECELLPLAAPALSETKGTVRRRREGNA